MSILFSSYVHRSLILALCALAVLTACIPQQEAILRIENVSDGIASLKRLEYIFMRLDFEVEQVYSTEERKMARVALEKEGDLAMGFRSTEYSHVKIIARFKASQGALEIKFLESPVSTQDFRFSSEALEQYNKFLAELRTEFGLDKIIVERPAK